MKLKLIVLLVLFPLILLSQQKSKKNKNSKKLQIPICDFYETQCLSLDSAETPYLYYQVYDWIGTKYKYAGDCKEGVDCSGFVNAMYESTYCLTLNGGSKDIWKIVTPVERKELKEGDILFFKIKKGQISHVGIYLGKDKFAHASVKSGVTISDLNEEYYKKHFFKGGRISSSIQ
jgi:murein DD-endopeptidase / murein LD-carboxypeptidase